ncbi:MAG: DUF3794 domain-containing protein, partial [Clostridia bacterium]|nr:DUF3794 domain-containing protein [Clostridia bacterium]
MAFEPLIREIDTKILKNLGTAKTQANVVLSTTNDKKIARVLSVSALPCVESLIPNMGTAAIEGKVNAQALVLTTEGEYLSLSGTINYSAMFNSQIIMAESKIFGCARSLGNDKIIATENSISFINYIEIPLIITQNQILEYVESASVAEQKVGSMLYSDLINLSNENFDINNEIELPSSVSKVISTETTGILKDAIAGNDMVTLKGEIYVTLVYMTNDEVPKLRSQVYTQDFTQEMLLTGVTTDNQISAGISVYGSTFEVQGELNSSKGVILLKTNFKSYIFAQAEKVLDVIEDAFCPKYELKLGHKSYSKQSIICKKYITDKVDGNISLDENAPRIDKVIATTAVSATISDIKIIDENVVASGVVFANVIYLLDDVGNTTQSIQVELPYETVILCENIDQEDNILLEVAVKDIEARNKKSKEIDVLAEIGINIIVSDFTNEAILSNIELGERRKENCSAMGVYVIS